MAAGSVVSVTGPSGSGKTTLIHRIMEMYPDQFGEAISHTTRPPRAGEVHGKDYVFIDEDEFDRMVENSEFLETVEFADRRYGSSYAEAKLKTADGKHALVVVEPHGKEQWMRNWDGPLIAVFLDVDEETCRDRMAVSGRMADDIEKRLEHDVPIFNVDTSEYHLCLANTDLEQSCSIIVDFLEQRASSASPSA